MSYIVHDIETCPLDGEHLKKIMPAFNPNDVAMGNTKDPEKVAAKLKEAQAEHEEKFFKRAALSAQTGRVLVLGLLLDTGSFEILEGDEKKMLVQFWEVWRASGEVPLVGWNCRKFDVPFLARRSWMLGLRTPELLKGRYLVERVVDLMEIWQCGNRESEAGSSSLGAVSVALGGPGKTGSGAEFGNLYVSSAKGREKALEYLKNDLTLTRDVGLKMGAIS